MQPDEITNIYVYSIYKKNFIEVLHLVFSRFVQVKPFTFRFSPSFMKCNFASIALGPGCLGDLLGKCALS